jgi:hypothetical protein
VPLPHDPGPHWGEVGIHGIHRQREWDVVTTVQAPRLEGELASFVVLDEGRVVIEQGLPDVEPLVRAVALIPPFRAEAVRRDGDLWAVAASRIETIDLANDPGGDTIELTWDGTERAVRIDGRPTLIGVPELEQVAARHRAYVVTASRIDGPVWEVVVTPL